MADSRSPTVMIAFADGAHGKDLALALAEEQGLAVSTPADFDVPETVDVAVTDGAPFDATTPWLVAGSVGPDEGDGRHPPSGILPADADPETIAAAIRLVAAGYRLVPASDRHAGHEHRPAGHQPLTPRESEVLALLANGASNKHVARALDISVHTAKFHVAALLSKLGARNRTDAIAIAMREGLLLL
jgi:DNA-binding CsgD family transcriptional regulator